MREVIKREKINTISSDERIQNTKNRKEKEGSGHGLTQKKATKTYSKVGLSLISSSEPFSLVGINGEIARFDGDVIASDGVEVFEGSLSLLHHIRKQGIKTAVVTSSANCDTVLQAAKIQDLFDAQVDGNTIVEQKLSGKPAPDSFLRAAQLLGVSTQRSVVIEDAISGVEAGRNGGFGLVIGFCGC